METNDLHYEYDTTQHTLKNLQKQVSAPETLLDTSPITLVASLLKDAQWLFLGENHPELAVKNFLITHMQALKSAGVTKLFIEMVASDSQHIIDDFFNDTAGSQEALLSYLDTRWWWYGIYTAIAYFKIIETAKKAGIKVYWIDPSKPLLQRSFDNEHWKRVITDTITSSDKYIVYGGSWHGDREHVDKVFNSSTKWITGHLNIQSVDMVNWNIDKVIKVNTNDSDYIVYVKAIDIEQIQAPNDQEQCLGYMKRIESIITNISFGNEDNSPEVSKAYKVYISSIESYKTNFDRKTYTTMKTAWDVFYSLVKKEKTFFLDCRRILQQIEVVRVKMIWE